MTFDIILTLFLVFLNGFFVAAEFAIVKVRSSQIDTRAGVSKTLNKTTKNILRHLDSNLAATQLGITLASLGLGWVGEGVVAELLKELFEAINLNLSATVIHSISIPLAFVLITIMHIVFGELAPKSIAIRKPVSISLIIAFPLKAFHKVFSPFIWLLNGFANTILKMIGIHAVGEGQAFSEEELKLIVTESQEGGAIDETEKNLIHKVFEFDDREVNDIRVPRTDILSINKAANLNDVAEFMIEKGFSRYPVFDENPDNIIGVAYMKDLLKAIHHKQQEYWTEWLRPPIFVPENKKIKDLLKYMQFNKIQMGFVVNEYGLITGLVTMEDILEELVGEIQDEFDNESSFVFKQSKGSYLVNAQKSISDLNKHLPYDLPESNHYDTLSGLALDYFKDFPKEGAVFPIGKYKIKIAKTEKKAVKKALIKINN